MAAAEEPAAAPQQGQDWEASKENFQPLKAGRKAAGLVLRDSTAELRTQAIEAKRRCAVQGASGHWDRSCWPLLGFVA